VIASRADVLDPSDNMIRSGEGFALPCRSTDSATPGEAPWHSPERKCGISSAVMA
jgi:hypothetical protein